MFTESLQNMEATIYHKDLPIVSFKVVNGDPEYITLHLENVTYFPFEFNNFSGTPIKEGDITMDNINDFVSARIVPRERYNLTEALATMGISEYRWDPMIKVMHGLCVDDCYWFKFPGDKFSYNDIKIRD